MRLVDVSKVCSKGHFVEMLLCMDFQFENFVGLISNFVRYDRLLLQTLGLTHTFYIGIVPE